MSCKDCVHYNVCYKKPIRSVDEDLVVIGGCSDYKTTHINYGSIKGRMIKNDNRSNYYNNHKQAKEL